MNQKRKKYFYLNHEGKSLLPSNKEVMNSDFSNQPYILIPDNNVCTHVSDLNTATQHSTKRAKAEDFLRYVSESKITVLPAWGLLERASQPGTLKFNKAKLEGFENAFWRKLNHDSNNNIPSDSTESIDNLKYIFYPIYAFLLKIRLILTEREPSAKNAKKNIEDLYEFAEDVKFLMPTIWQFAIAIFGGDTRFNRLIKPGEKDVFKALWGATWDIFYLQLPYLFYGIRETNNTYPQCIFATDDEACGMIGSLMKVSTAIDYGKVIYNQTSLNFNFPHWKQMDNFLFKVSYKINSHANERSIRRKFMSETEYQNDIQMIIDKSEEYILQFTHLLKDINK
jgi:hypothetical protein